MEKLAQENLREIVGKTWRQTLFFLNKFKFVTYYKVLPKKSSIF